MNITYEIALQWHRAGRPDWGWWVTMSDADRETFAVAGDELFATRHASMMPVSPTPEQQAEAAKQLQMEIGKLLATPTAADPRPAEIIEPPQFQDELSEEDEARMGALLNAEADKLQSRMEAARNGRN